MPEETVLAVEGMTCVACVRRVERALEKVEGVERSQVNLASHEAVIVHGPEVDSSKLMHAIEHAGYKASLPVEGSEDHSHADAKPVELWSAIALTIPIFVVSMFWHHRPGMVNIALGVATTWVIFFSGGQFFANAWRALRHGGTNMDTLIALGSASAWAYSVVALAIYGPGGANDHIYFETGAVIVTFVLAGRYMEVRSRTQMTAAVTRLLNLAPKLATQILPNGETATIPADQLKPGDRLQVKAGEAVPADGTIAAGESEVDESMLTGESTPVAKFVGDEVTGGTQNTFGSFEMVVSRVGQMSTLSQIARLVERAQSSRAPVQALADKISSIFVPAAILTAVLTFAYYSWAVGGLEVPVLRAVAVLVIACPCALGLATPTALIVGMGRAANLGILIRDGDSLQRAEKVKTVLFDKTGTLTEGAFTLDAMRAVTGSPERALQIAASLEYHSEHPVAKAVVNAATEKSLALLPVENFKTLAGSGVRGTIEGVAYELKALRAELRPGHLNAEFDVAEKARNTLFGLFDGSDQLIAWFGVRDSIRENAKGVVQALHRQGIQVGMVTGDSRAVADSVAEEIGIEFVDSEVKPWDKVKIVRNYQQSGRVVFVGDGINDSPALGQADLGIALGSGSDIAKSTAGITLLRTDLYGVPHALYLCSRVLHTVRMNLVWAFGYNVVMIPLAIAGTLNPMLAAGAMSLSSLTVIGNSLRLRWVQPPGSASR